MSAKENNKARIPITGKWWTSGCKIVRHVIKSCHCDDDDDNNNQKSQSLSFMETETWISRDLFLFK